MSGTVAVVGSGYMGGGIAQVLALAGYAVRIADVELSIAVGNRERVIAEAATFAADGLFPEDAADIVQERVTAATVEDAVAGAVFIEEAVPERVDIKHATLRRISEAAEPLAIIGSNTSTISIGTLAEAVVGAHRFVGVHFSNPAPFIPGVEVIPHEGTDPDVTAEAQRIVRSVGKQPALVKDMTGFVLNRLQYALFIEANKVLEDGVATAADIDRIVRSTFGVRLPFFGPFAVADMAGLDVYRAGLQSLADSGATRFAPPETLKGLVDDGRIGAKGGGGYYDVGAEELAEVIAYRNRAYVAVAKLVAELGPQPLG